MDAIFFQAQKVKKSLCQLFDCNFQLVKSVFPNFRHRSNAASLTFLLKLSYRHVVLCARKRLFTLTETMQYSMDTQGRYFIRPRSGRAPPLSGLRRLDPHQSAAAPITDFSVFGRGRVTSVNGTKSLQAGS